MTQGLDNNPLVTESELASIHQAVFGWALTRCDYRRDVAEDLVQQAYVQLLSGRARYDGKSSLKTFVFAVVQKLAQSRFRRLSVRLRFAQRADREEPVTEDSGAADESAIWQRVSELPARQRDIVELVFCRELTIEEASRVMGISVGTGRVHYDRAKKRLRELLDDDER